jgi:hypothetical protein
VDIKGIETVGRLNALQVLEHIKRLENSNIMKKIPSELVYFI